MTGTGEVGDSARSTVRRHDGETSGSGADSAGASTAFRKKEQRVAPACTSGAEITIGWQGVGRI